ncbi:MAG TPA: tetratricopeptide repeat protein [Gemmatimonadaceae bacterium]|jgi:serine/threonine-protein kinase|nr:tetratricopeptide repeat protein [Gemmatimonadaceae bacterium]
MAYPPLDPQRRRAIEELFEGALDQPPPQRTAWLNVQCSEAGLRADVEALLRAHDRDGILDQVPVSVADAVPSQHLDRQIGPYRVRRELGRGGMGVVYLAERTDGQYRRQVAVKLLRNSPDADELHRRFLAERQILASLNHPNIAQLLDGGVTDGHLPYLVMEYVDGVPITTYCDQQRLGIEERLLLFREVCAAVHHAHQNLVIHRDIKPSNILVTQERRVKLLDFGIAKLLDPTLGPDEQPMTRTEWRILTPEYASPEQVRGDSLTTASDVYTLGVVLYELLCGRRPHRTGGGSAHELAQRIVQREPPLPSVAASRREPNGLPGTTAGEDTPVTIAATRGLSVDRLRRRLHGDLDAIVMMALRKESARRYGSANLMWEDVQRHLDGLPVLAHHATRWYRARKFLGRHRIPALASAVVLVSLITGASIAVRQAAVASRERDRAEQALAQATEVSEFLVRLFRTAAPPGASRDEVTARDLLATGTARIEELASQPIVQAQMLDALGRVNDQLGRFDDAERMLRRALALRRAHLGETHLDVATTLTNLSITLRQRGKTAEALQLAREALAIQERVLGPRHPTVALTLTDMALLTGDATHAESLVRTARDIQRAALGPAHMDVTSTNSTLVDFITRRGEYDEAEALLRENLSIRERLVGPEHAATANSLMVLGNFLLSYRAQPAAAESLFTQALGILRRQPKPSLPNIFGVLSGLIGVAERRGDYAQAEAYAREALDVQRRVWGPDHPMTIDAMGLVAQQLGNQRRYAEAEAIDREALVLMEHTVGPRHGRVARVLSALGRLRAAQGRDREAEADFRRALAILETEYDPRDRWVGAQAALLAQILARRGKHAEADSLFARAADILRPLPRAVSADIRAAYAALADHFAAKRPEDAELFRQRAGGGS